MALFSLTPPLTKGKRFTLGVEFAGSIIYYINIAHDTVKGGSVCWDSPSSYDTTGTLYPGPGVWGVSAGPHFGLGTRS